ncbi:hypothetical protein I4U23_016579 [Adineta vaga]|nr:hypothetical protein I4U23_016579 [Adineta vaga]
MDRLLIEFRDKHAAEMDELDYYVLYIKMQKENVQNCDSFVKKVIPFMSYNLFDTGDPRNLIKKCPNPECGLIWFKTEGCDGTTTCGNSSFSSYFDHSSKPFWRYALEWVNGKLQWKKNVIDEKQLPISASKPFGRNTLQKMFNRTRLAERIPNVKKEDKKAADAKKWVAVNDLCGHNFQNSKMI